MFQFGQCVKCGASALVLGEVEPCCAPCYERALAGVVSTDTMATLLRAFGEQAAKLAAAS